MKLELLLTQIEKLNSVRLSASIWPKGSQEDSPTMQCFVSIATMMFHSVLRKFPQWQCYEHVGSKQVRDLRFLSNWFHTELSKIYVNG